MNTPITPFQPTESKANAIMEVQSIELTYGSNPIIANLSTRIHSSSFIGLIGPNGAGKSTLLRSLSGQFRPQKGRISFENLDIYQSNIQFKHKVGYVHENPFSYPYLTVEEFLHFVARVKNVQKSEIEARIASVLESVCLDEEKQKPTSELSMGMRKKLAIAAALLGNPKIIFLDEALNGIDIESTFKIKQVLQDIVADGRTIILSSHVLEVIEKICDRYLVLRNGKIIADLNAHTFKETDLGGNKMDLENYIIQLLRPL